MYGLSDPIWWIIVGIIFLVMTGVLVYEIWALVKICSILMDILN